MPGRVQQSCGLAALGLAALAATGAARPFLPPRGPLAAGAAPVCWKDAHGRGVGKPISACDASKGLEKSGALCYPTCKRADPSYYGVGPVCWQHCRDGYVDEGALCRKHGSIVTYAKKSYGRGAGYPLTCPAGQEEDAALCYPPCPSGFYGVGPVCWERCPVATNPTDGGAVCCTNGTECSQKIRDLAGGLPLAVMEALLSGGNATKIEQSVIDALNSLLGFVMPKCDDLSAAAAADHRHLAPAPVRAALVPSHSDDADDDRAKVRAAVAKVAAAVSAKYNCSISATVYSESRGLNESSAAGAVSFAPHAPDAATSDRYIWGSITKISTGSAILKLAQEGKLSIDDPVCPYVDPMLAAMHKQDPANFNYTSCADLWGPMSAMVTIRHLATMNSGIPDFDTAKPYPPPPQDPLRQTIYGQPAHDFTPPELLSVSWVATGKLDFIPGHSLRGFAYSSTNFILLGLVLAHFGGADSWDTFDQTSFLPAEVKSALSSVEYVRKGAPSDVSRLSGYDRTSYNGADPKAMPGVDVADVHGVFGGWSASDYTSTAADAARLAYEVYGPQERIIDETHQDIMIPTCPASSHHYCIYGFATFNLTGQTGHDAPMGTAYGHIGATYGYDSMLSYHPELDVSIAIASNMENDDQTHPSEALCLLFSGVKNALTGSTESCVYSEAGYYGGECKCT